MYNQELIDTVIADKFKIVRRIGGGSFGEIYLCLGPNGTEVPMSTNQLYSASKYFMKLTFKFGSTKNTDY